MLGTIAIVTSKQLCSPQESLTSLVSMKCVLLLLCYFELQFICIGIIIIICIIIILFQPPTEVQKISAASTICTLVPNRTAERVCHHRLTVICRGLVSKQFRVR